jgi:hypothetical protein
MRLGIILSASLLISLPLLVQTQCLMHTSFQETAINIRRESILRVQWGKSVCGCTVKHLLHRSRAGARSACFHHLETLLSHNEAGQSLVNELT